MSESDLARTLEEDCPLLDPDELGNREASEWPKLRPRLLQELERRGMDLRETPDEALPGNERCPRCGWPVFQVTMVGPDTKILGPCGCRMGGVGS